MLIYYTITQSRHLDMDTQITVKFKTMKQNTYELSVDKNDIIESKLQTIVDLSMKDHDITDSDLNNLTVKIIYSGKVLQLKNTFEQEKICNGSCVIIYVKKKEIPVSTPAPAPVSAPAPASTPVRASAPIYVSQNYTSIPLYSLNGLLGTSTESTNNSTNLIMNEISSMLNQMLQPLTAPVPTTATTATTTTTTTTSEPILSSPSHTSTLISNEAINFWKQEADAS